jgi:glycosyltransferase involved in cell wall biosynthesis
MRVGQNPAKSIDHLAQPERVTVAIVTYIPFLNGYYEQSLDVLKVCLDSLRQNTSLPYDLLVFDNASCQEVRSYLQELHTAGRIQYLVLSDRNVGKGGAWNLIFQGAPGEIVAYADSDIYFYPGWLDESLRILESFPKVGMVTARPLRTPETYYSSTLEWAQNTAGVTAEQGQFMSWEIYQEHTDSLGVPVEQAQEWFQTTYDRRIQYGSLTAFIGAAHFQFTAYKQVLLSLAPLKMDRPMGQVRSLDEKLNQMGYLRLTTAERQVKHLGNRLDNSSLRSPLNVKRSTNGDRSTLSQRLRNFPPIRRSLLWLYDKIFRMYYSK